MLLLFSYSEQIYGVCEWQWKRHRERKRERAIDIEKRSKKTFSLCFVHFATKQICYYYFTFLLAKRMWMIKLKLRCKSLTE